MNFNIKTKIKINGKEYASVDELPADIRQMYEKAMQGNTQRTTKIKFNGQEFASVENMPPEVRKMYEAVMGAVEAQPHPDPTGNISPGQSQQIANAIADGKKIEAIKLYRRSTNCDLKDAKDFIEKLAIQLHGKDPARYALPQAGKGCLGLVLILGGVVAVIVS
jgi:ribosomal protein L7/L12